MIIPALQEFHLNLSRHCAEIMTPTRLALQKRVNLLLREFEIIFEELLDILAYDRDG